MVGARAWGGGPGEAVLDADGDLGWEYESVGGPR